MTDTFIPEIRCPGCGMIDWTQDGFAVWADRAKVDLGRFRRGDGRDEPWSCRGCGHALGGDEPLSGALSQLRLAHLD